MSSTLTIYSHSAGPNPLKVLALAKALGVSYKTETMEFGDGPNGVKNPKFLKLNPNGRVPAIVDHSNNDFVVWESAACMQYLVDKYDTTHKFCGKTIEENAVVNSWLYFQMSGQGPSQGQVAWFKNFHTKYTGNDVPQHIIDRYESETYRIYNVYEERLKAQQFVALSDRLTIADIAAWAWFRKADFCQLDMSQFPKINALVKHIDSQPWIAAVDEEIKAAESKA